MTFPFLLTKYNDEFTLKNIVQLIQNTNNEIITYKFSDFLNISYEVNKNIEDLENKDIISKIPKNRKTFIVSREKYKDEIEENNKFKLLYNNRAYYLYSN